MGEEETGNIIGKIEDRVEDALEHDAARIGRAALNVRKGRFGGFVKELNRLISNKPGHGR